MRRYGARRRPATAGQPAAQSKAALRPRAASLPTPAQVEAARLELADSVRTLVLLGADVHGLVEWACEAADEIRARGPRA